NGTLNVTLSGAATISAGANDSTTLTVSGSLADINATLASLSYQGSLNYNGGDTLTMTSTDGNSATDVDTVAIMVTNVNDPTTIGGQTGYTGVEGDVGSGTLTATDPDGLTDGSLFSVTTPATQGTAAIDPATGAWTFTPTDPNWFGTDSFTVTVTDDQGGTTTQVISVTLANVNDGPVAANDAYTTSEDIPLTTTLATGVLANDSDVDGDTLTVNPTPIVNVTNGSLVLNADGSFTYTPNSGWSGVDTFTYQVTDGNGGSTQATVTLTVVSVNDVPVITSHGGGVSASLSLAENLAGVTTMTATDVDGDPLTYSIVGGADAARFTVDAITGAVSFVGTPDFENPTDVGGNNVYDVTVQVSDGNGGVDTQAISVTVTDVQEGLSSVTPPPPLLQTATDPTPDPGFELSPDQTPDQAPDSTSETPSDANDSSHITPAAVFPETLGGQSASGPEFSRGPSPHSVSDWSNVLDLPPFLRPESYGTTSEQIRSFSPDPLLLSNIKLGHEFLQQLNSFSNDLEETTQHMIEERSFFVKTMKVAGLGFSTAIVGWLVRSGTLLTSLLASMPAWQNFDPVAILNMDKKSREDWAKKMKEAADREAREQRGFHQIFEPKTVNLSPPSSITHPRNS
ncbi:MAG: tandem-95 repeat protein, partial [Nitrospirota bacterium]|nr:tandem-95 repeat protein [Nitrospirota bacterium]